MDKKVYLGYKPKEVNVTKLKNYLNSVNQQALPINKVMQLNKNK